MQRLEQARAWVDVDARALRTNYETIRRAVGPDVAIIPMVKADAYGLGAMRVIDVLDPLGPWGYGVAAAAEGAALREAGVARPILVTSPLPPDDVPRAAAAGLTASISDLAALGRWRDAARAHGPLDFHVEVDTGMGRAGFDWREIASWAPVVAGDGSGAARWSGIFTHMHSADAGPAAATQTQWGRFQDALAQLPVSREDLMVHVSNSAVSLRWPEYALDAVRPGIFLYGGRVAAEGAVPPAPVPAAVVSVRARVILVRDVPPGSSVGYGATHVARGWERWATLSIGYGDGLPRALGNQGHALLHGKKVPLIGRISMDMCVVDITDRTDATAGDVATLIGSDGDAGITVDEVAQQVGTISYEILTGLTQRLPRVVRNTHAAE
ncbi:MAG TPA: alanine racemase [Longimicrobiales bacterium]